MVSNICTSGQPAHIASLVENGCIVPLCDLLDISDSKILLVGLEALESICKVGLQTNNVSFAQMIEQCSGVRDWNASRTQERRRIREGSNAD